MRNIGGIVIHLHVELLSVHTLACINNSLVVCMERGT